MSKIAEESFVWYFTNLETLSNLVYELSQGDLGILSSERLESIAKEPVSVVEHSNYVAWRTESSARHQGEISPSVELFGNNELLLYVPGSSQECLDIIQSYQQGCSLCCTQARPDVDVLQDAARWCYEHRIPYLAWLEYFASKGEDALRASNFWVFPGAPDSDIFFNALIVVSDGHWAARVRDVLDAQGATLLQHRSEFRMNRNLAFATKIADELRQIDTYETR